MSQSYELVGKEEIGEVEDGNPNDHDDHEDSEDADMQPLVLKEGIDESSPTKVRGFSASVLLFVLLAVVAGGGIAVLLQMESKHDNVADFKAFRERFQKAHLATRNRLANEDYGPENYKRMFELNGTSMGLLALRSAGLPEFHKEIPSLSDIFNGSFPLGVSWERIKRKFMLKVLQAQQLRKKPKDVEKMVSFIWATGGHSAAAGHGNLYNESYSAVLERFVGPSFQELGIRFQGKNYAMGGTPSGPKVALCAPAIFGNDIDILSWDFGMTDGENDALIELYFRQASRLPNRPACIGLIAGGYGYDLRLKVLRNLEQSGVPALYLPQEVQWQVQHGVPDTFGLTQAEIDAVPPFVRNFKCDGQLEGGDPGCGDNKWTEPENCSYIKFRTGWHPGWKNHALIGNLVGIAVLDIMDEALADLEQLDLSDLVARYNELKALEDEDYATFAKSDLTSNHTELIKDYTEWNHFDIPYLFKNRAICRTARLPAESRFLGIMTESNRTGFFGDEKGVSRDVANNQPNNEESIRLVYEDRQDWCDVLVQADYKDYFFLKHEEGMKKLVLPNKEEIKEYGRGEPLKGLVAFTFGISDWNDFPKEESRESGLELGEWEMTINGVQVKKLLYIKDSVNFAWHSGGFYFTPNSSGQYEIQVRVKAEGKFLRFSSFIFL